MDDALWTYRIAYKTPIDMFPFRILYEKMCHLPVKVEHKAYWATHVLNMDYDAADGKRLLNLDELEELRLHCYRSSEMYKEKTKY